MYYKGTTGADTGVINHSYTGSLGHNSWQKSLKGKNFVLARPGDRVQFYETFCFPVQQVGRQTKNQQVKYAEAPPTSQFEIFAEKNGGRNNNYLFGDSPVHDGQIHSINNSSARPVTGSGITAEDLSKQYQVSVPTIRRWVREAKEGVSDKSEEKIAFVMSKDELRDFILETVRDAN